jgi:hypothetical protein
VKDDVTGRGGNPRRDDEKHAAAFVGPQPSVVASVLPVLQAISRAMRTCGASGLLDRNGIVTSAIEEPLVGKNLSALDYVRAALQGRAVVSDIHVAQQAGDRSPESEGRSRKLEWVALQLPALT